MKKMVTIKKSGKKPLRFEKGGLHRSVGVPQGEKIPASKMAAAKHGAYGPKAKKQADFATGALAAGRRTAARHYSTPRRAASPVKGPTTCQAM